MDPAAPRKFPNTGAAGARRDSAPTADVPGYASADLFRGRDRLSIEHNGERYTLRITRQGKLILTK
jgi:hemin uptake protein HemP